MRRATRGGSEVDGRRRGVKLQTKTKVFPLALLNRWGIQIAFRITDEGRNSAVKEPAEKEKDEKGGRKEGMLGSGCVDSRPLCRRNARGEGPMRPKETRSTESAVKGKF